MKDKTLYERRGDGVRLLTLNDPDRRNAIGPDLQSELAERVSEVASDTEARALVLAGEGTAFCAGADLPTVFTENERSVTEIRQDLKDYYQCFLPILDLQIPTIAAVHGPAIGAGLNLALCCDLRLAGPDASFGATFSRIGLHPGGGCTFFLTRCMGAQRALRVLLQGDTLDADRAVASGLADEQVEEPLEAALATASRFAGLDPEICRDIKQAVRLSTEHGLAASLEFEAWAQASSAKRPVVQELVARFRERDDDAT